MTGSLRIHGAGAISIRPNRVRLGGAGIAPHVVTTGAAPGIKGIGGN
jgi:hypothetical protein